MIGTRYGQRRKRPQRGAAAVELALIFPLFLLLIGGMLSLGQAVWARYLLTNMAVTAARACVLAKATTTSAVANTCVSTRVNDIAAAIPVNGLCKDAPVGSAEVVTLPSMPSGQPSVPTVSVGVLRASVTCNRDWIMMPATFTGMMSIKGSGAAAYAN